MDNFCKELQVLETILGRDGKHEVKEVRYPSYQKAKILTVHLRRLFVPRQINIAVQSRWQDSPEIKVLMKEKGVFTKHFKKEVFRRAVKEAKICGHCVIGAWAYVRVGVDTHVMWMKGEGKNIDFIQEELK